MEHDDPDATQVVIYLHWGGDDGPGIVARALHNYRGRWTDSPYFTACIFRQLVEDGYLTPGSETGIGIQKEINEEEYITTEVYLSDSKPGSVRYGTIDLPFEKFIQLGIDTGWIQLKKETPCSPPSGSSSKDTPSVSGAGESTPSPSESSAPSAGPSTA
jgi:hypothetical protein